MLKTFIKCACYLIGIRSHLPKSFKILSFPFSAIVQLETPVKLTDKNKASICLPDDDHKPPNGHMCYVAGWGQQKEDDTKSCPDILRHVGLRIVPRKECNKEESYGGLISNSMLCAGFKEGLKDHCFNDNGGSLVCNVDGKQILIFLFKSFYLGYIANKIVTNLYQTPVPVGRNVNLQKHLQKFGEFSLFAIRPKLCENCAFPQNFHTRKLGEITVFYALRLKVVNFQAILSGH